MNYSGRNWTVGRTTAEGAIRSFERRVANNVACSGTPGAVIAFERSTRRPLLWSDEVNDPEAVLDYFVSRSD